MSVQNLGGNTACTGKGQKCGCHDTFNDTGCYWSRTLAQKKPQKHMETKQMYTRKNLAMETHARTFVVMGTGNVAACWK